VRALSGNLPTQCSTLLLLRNCETCKTTHGTEHRSGEDYFDHVPTSIAERLVWHQASVLSAAFSLATHSLSDGVAKAGCIAASCAAG
jgi:hypothetical protein